jgi:AcrR family transcriptional regulator
MTGFRDDSVIRGESSFGAVSSGSLSLLNAHGTPADTTAFDREWERANVLELQRGRMLDALAEIVAAQGLRRTTITAVAAQASVSPTTFTEVFDGVEPAFASLVRHVTVQTVRLACEAYDREPSWQLGVLSGVEALLSFLDSEPSLARVWLVEAFAGSPRRSWPTSTTHVA